MLRTNAIDGLSYHYFPKDLSDKLDKDTLDQAHNITINGENQVYIFTGDMPTQEELYNIDSVSTLLANHGDNLAIKVGTTAADAFEFNAKYAATDKRRTIKKWPVDSKVYNVEANITATTALTWAAIKIINPGGGAELFVFTDSIGDWNSDEIVVLVDKLVIKGGDTVEVKDITIDVNDVLITEVNSNANPVELVFSSTDGNVAGGNIKIAVSNFVPGDAVTLIKYDDNTLTNGVTEDIVIDTVTIDSVSVDGIDFDPSTGTVISTPLASGNVIVAQCKGTIQTLVVA